MKTLILLACVLGVAMAIAPREERARKGAIANRGDLRCTFRTGRAKGGPPYMIKNTIGRDCKDVCVDKKLIGNGKRISGVTIMKNRRAKYCACERNMYGIDKSQTQYRTCFLLKAGEEEPPYDSPSPPPTVEESSAPPGLTYDAYTNTYSNFKDKCEAATFQRDGCYATSNKGKLLVYWRYDIEWSKERHAAFACALVTACAEAASHYEVEYFATHFWGECWEVKKEELTEVADGSGCSLADGNYDQVCDDVDSTNECLGVKNYYVYKPTGVTPSKTKGAKGGSLKGI